MDPTTALTLLVCEPYCTKINEIRCKYDRAYPRWQPHINFLFPFVEIERFPEIENKLQSVLNEFGKFNLVFNQLGYFSQGKNVTFHLKVSDDEKLQELFQKIRDVLPEIKPKHDKFEPHLTLGQCKKTEVESILDNLRANWLGFGFTVEVQNISLINRSKTDNLVPFSEHTVINL